MNKAQYNGKLFDIHTLPREKYELVYEQSLRNKWTCPMCGGVVRFHLAIEHAPHFYHVSHACIKEERKQANIISIRPTEPFQTKEKKQMTVCGIPLDTEQYEAVQHVEGPLLVLAGAGSGKTRTLTTRAAAMIAHHRIQSKNIMIVTFTTKAAKELVNRLQSYNLDNIPTVGTFHSLFYRMLQHADPFRWRHERLIRDWQKEKMMKEIGRDIGIDERDFPYDEAMQRISYWKNTLTPLHTITVENEWDERVVQLYKQYEAKKQQLELFDFDDMLYACYNMLRTDERRLRQYHERFHYFLIDEFQDINSVQYETMKLLASHTHHICAVGDDDQAIYAFRGSDSSFIQQFQQDFPNTKIVKLTENYRSPHPIVSLANRIIAKSRTRIPKQMNAQTDSVHMPTLFFPYDEEEEATMIACDIEERMKQGVHPSDIAILCRTNASARAVFERLSQLHIPVTTDGDSFYNRRIVRYLLSFFQLALDQNDEQAMTDVATVLFLKQTIMNDLKANAILQDCSLVEALAKLDGIPPFQKQKLRTIAPLFVKVKEMKPFDAIDFIEKEMGLGEFLKKRGNEGNAIEKGSDDVRDMKVVARKFKTIQAFLSHVKRVQAYANKTCDDGVQLMTIHRSKGLEFPIVYIIGAVDGLLPHDYALEAYRNGDVAPLEEERRLLYVAITRAKQRLFISVPSMRRLKKANASRLLSFLQTKAKSLV
ncbi:ATP-dependent helicase [Anoxybacillus sp. LAT_35]|uniref:ATP-dependent helicase n=1 Tax=unclassified Anoxybacillus TaxID=2639704 RepID=UPI001EDB9714|nr:MULTISPECIES: ATP-dependent helicase [unclassified Anoxybacillus]MCG5025961.1 ATP-dependent helicase [Anoxybacillus flavithermus]MCG3085569.1 ATP-dependent helicase [Anoxybacillus sp. LAT27]MCG6170827.1 ATP-dependent helicase [Anoxybacillus sp. LAT_11]MCG6175818.1 ATP-dependent helicase [Anoxybacillus sp. LAT_31]MCG6177521.1 ATP-dependent helicase [Anoxybacillus sp. LAT_35]